MIISASRRTDLPAFHGDWFMERLQSQVVRVVNPMNRSQISSLSLKKEDVDCFVFWTKNPQNFLKYLPQIDSLGYNYYFQFTLNPYGESLEPHVGVLNERIKIFKELSSMIGPQRVIWRYDPIILTSEFSPQWHRDQFAYLGEELGGNTNRCVISFLDWYKKIKKPLAKINITTPTQEQMLTLVSELAPLADKNKISLESCALSLDLTPWGVQKGSCVDKRLIEEITGKRVTSAKDRGQRKGCGCVMSRDLGEYQTCGYSCLYCYAQ